MKIKIYDDQFTHVPTMANGDLGIKSKYFEWSRDLQGSRIAFITESWFDRIHTVTEPVKIGILLEPRGFAPKWYEWIKHNYNKFSFILTHDLNLIKISPKFLFYPYAGSWIYPKDYACYPKTKNVSMVASSKQELEGHILRHDVKCKVKNIDFYGRDSNKLDYLLDAYKDYRFTIVIENNKYDYWFTEKITNPLFCGCVPIYWGCPSIENFFDEIPQFNTTSELVNLLSTFDFEKEYEVRKTSIESNLKAAKSYAITEDWIWEHVLTRLSPLL